MQGEHTTQVIGGIGDSQQIKKSTLTFEGKEWLIITQHRLCPTTSDDVLSQFRAAMIDGFIVGYAFDNGKFLAREMRDRAVGGNKVSLAYLFLITQICLAARVLEIPEVDELIEARRTLDIGFIPNETNPLTQPVRQSTDVIEGMLLQNDQTDNSETAETSETSAQTMAKPTDAVGTSSGQPPVQSMPPRPHGTPPGVTLIFEVAQIEVVTKLATLTVNVGHIEGGVQSWMDRKFEA